MFVDLSEVLRLIGTDIPHDFAVRVPVLAEGFDADTSVLGDILALNASGGRLTAEEALAYHGRVYRLLSEVIGWMEVRWPTTNG